MPTNERSKPGLFQDIVEEAGFTDAVVREYSENIKPVLWLLHIMAAVPFVLVRHFRLEKYFINTVAGARGGCWAEVLALRRHLCDQA